MVSAKGKEKVSDSGGKGKRKWSGGADDYKTGRKRKNRSGALKFFDDASYEDNMDSDDCDNDDEMFDFDFFEDESASKSDNKNESENVQPVSFIPKEEVMSEEEFERMMEDRYKPGAGFVTHTEDTYDRKRLEGNMHVPSTKDPTIWKVKCMVDRERYSAFCLMQKYVDLKCLGNKLQIISAFAPDHIKGFIFIEADKQSDIYEACKGLCTIYSTKSAPFPNSEMSQLLSVRNKSCGISKGMWARVKSGKYKGDLAMVVAVNDSRKKVTAKLIPRIDLKAMAGKFGGGIPAKRTAIPAQRLISSSELEEFRPLIQFRRDRDTNEMFEFLDGMMLKDGYLYKKIPMDSLNYWGVVPTEVELLKFESSKKDESTDVQWLSQLFGEKKKQQVQDVKQDKGGGKSKGPSSSDGKSKGSSSSDVGTSFMHDLVFFGRRDFGVVIGSEKGDSVKVIKEGSEGPSVITIKQSDLKRASFDKKLFTVVDHHSNTVSINDCVRILEGPLKDKQGIVKKIYKGILFLCDESEQENDGYICIKGQLCEKVDSSGVASNAKGSEPGSSSFMDLPPSPKSPLSPSKSWQEKDDKCNFKRQENGMFSVGQSLRIRVGPLKGYLCRVLAVRRSDVTVKLDSQKKILTVKSEHLSEVRGRNPAISQGEDSGIVKPFDFLETHDGASGWMDGATLSTEVNNWNAGGSNERSSWSSLPTSSFSLPNESGSVDPVDGDAMKEDSGWQIKATSNQNSSWGAVSVGEKTVPNTGPVDGWGTGSGWKQATTAVSGGTSDSWGKLVEPPLDNSDDAEKNESWGKAAEKWSTAGDNCGIKVSWGQSDVSSDRQSGGWGDASRELNKPEASTWKNDKFALSDSAVADESKWKNQDDTKIDGVGGWGKSGPAWGKGRDSELEGLSEKNQEHSQWNLSEKWNDKSASVGNSVHIGISTGDWVNSGSANTSDSQTKNWDTKMVGGIATEKGQADSWNKPKPVGVDGGSSWKQDSKSLWGKQDGTSLSNKHDEGPSWSKPNEGSAGGNEWSSSKRNEDDKPSGWNMPNVSKNSGSSDWGKTSTGNVDGWNKERKPNENNKPSWTTENTSFDGQSSDWSKKGNRGSYEVSEENNLAWTSVSQDKAKDGQGGQVAQVGSWKSEKNADGGSSIGWGQSNWLKGETPDTGGNQGSSWSGKSNWNSGNGTDRSNNLDDTGDGGRGGNWRGRGGRGDRGGFRGRGGSGRGGFGGRDDSDHGGFESRWGSDRGGIGGRGRSDREGGFRGHGGFRGRGRGDWNNSGGDLREEKPYSWNRGSNDDSEGWKSSGSRGSRNWGDKESNQGTNLDPSTQWNKPSDNSEMDTWQPKESNKGGGQSGSWGKAVSASWETASQNESSRWSKAEPSNENKTKEYTKDRETSDSWGKDVAGSRETAQDNASSFGNWNRPKASDGGQTKDSDQNKGPSDSWGKLQLVALGLTEVAKEGGHDA